MAGAHVMAMLALAATSLISQAQAQGEAMQLCGAARYFPSEYACYGNRTLCPIMYGLPSVSCDGAAGCYASQMFACEAGAPKTLPAATKPFALTVHGTRPTYQNMTVKACGGFLAVGANARQCTSCSGAAPGVQCSSYGNQAVLLPNGDMAADIPGGQYWYLNPTDGALQYVTGTEAPEKEFAGRNVTIYQDGFFAYDGMPHYWLACLRTLPGGVPGTGRTWRIYSPAFGNLERDCEQVRLVATSVDRKQGAYKYD